MEQSPFRGSDALRQGIVTRQDLRRRHHAIFRDVYVPDGAEITASTRAEAAWLATGATLAGVSAAAVLGTRWLDASQPAEVVRADRHGPSGLVAHSWTLGPGEVACVGGMRVTTPARTAFDIGRTRPRADAIPIIDALMQATRLRTDDVLAVADVRPGARGVERLRRTLQVVDGGAESPQESRLRVLLVDAGLPRPETQIEFRQLRIRVDMGWRRWKVAVEYDGVQHWTDARQRAWDIERIELLEAAGWVVVRVSAQMLHHPLVVVERVRAKLRAAGCPI